LDYPVYRKLSNNKSFYKILSEYAFEEIQMVGPSAIKTKISAQKFPEILRIKEMISLSEPFLKSSVKEYQLYASML